MVYLKKQLPRFSSAHNPELGFRTAYACLAHCKMSKLPFLQLDAVNWTKTMQTNNEHFSLPRPWTLLQTVQVTSFLSKNFRSLVSAEDSMMQSSQPIFLEK
jgi:hypothetical protein